MKTKINKIYIKLKKANKPNQKFNKQKKSMNF